jgi:transposase
MTGRSQHYPQELRERAVRMVFEWRELRLAVGGDQRGRPEVGVGTAGTARKWVRQAETDIGRRPGTTSEDSAELKWLRRGSAGLRRANETSHAA